MNIADLHIIGNSTIFYEGIKHYFIYPSNDSYTMTIEEIGKDGDMETSYKDFVSISDAIKHIEQGENKTMTKKQFDKINNDVNKLLNGEKIRGIDLSVYDIRELVNVLENLKKKPEFINSNVKKFCDKYDIKVCECGIGWKVL